MTFAGALWIKVKIYKDIKGSDHFYHSYNKLKHVFVLLYSQLTCLKTYIPSSAVKTCIKEHVLGVQVDFVLIYQVFSAKSA